MVEANHINAPQQENPETVHFYERSSGFGVIKEAKNVSECLNNTHLGHPLHYPVQICQNKSFPSDLLIANTNHSVRIMDMETGSVTSLQGNMHSKPITALHCPEAYANNEFLVHVFMTASQDGLVKFWDRRSNTSVAHVNTGGGRIPFYSVGTNNNLIAAGTNEDLLFWDIHKLQKPIGRFDESHSEDVTAIKFDQDAPHMMISCAIDNVLNMFNLQNDGGNARLVEEDLIDGAYSSTQPMIDCGFVSSEIIWTLTSINTVEFIRVSDAICFMHLTEFPHDVTSLIGVEVSKGANAGGQPYRVLVYGGNIQGEVYIYEVSNLDEAFAGADSAESLPKAQLRLIDMILTNEPLSVRQVQQVGEKTFAICTENNKVQILQHNPQLKAQANLQAQAQMLQELEDMDL